MTAPSILLPREEDEATVADARWFAWVGTVDHKRVGILYLWTAFFFFVVGGCEALLNGFRRSRSQSSSS